MKIKKLEQNMLKTKTAQKNMSQWYKTNHHLCVIIRVILAVGTFNLYIFCEKS